MKNISSLFKIHIAVMFFGLSGLFGKWIDLPALLITWGRCVFAFMALFFFILFSRERFALRQTGHYFIFTAVGFLLALHWWAFFHSIQISTVAVGLLTFSTFPVFTVFLEPLFFKERIRWTDIMAALFTFGGIILMTPIFDLNDSITIGAVFGVLSGLTFAVLQILNRKYVQMYSGRLITFYQTGVAAFVLLPMIPFSENSFTMSNILMLMILGVLCTATAHSLFISGLRSVKVRSASIIAGLEPVYGIVFAMIFLCEMPSCKEIYSGIVILTAVAFVSIKKKDVSFTGNGNFAAQK
jgi:drug/metabolite transporter (DMT)-like permease